MQTERDYYEFWEKSWNDEDVDDLSRWLEGWDRSTDDELELLKSLGVKRVCDAACGFGAHTLAFASNGFDVSAFDVSSRAVELTTAGLRKYGHFSVEVKTAEITDTGYADGSFDAAAAYAVLDHLTEADARRALNELFRITKADGYVLLSFDSAEEEDYLCPHELLPDGSMLYKDDTPRAGMLFRPCGDELISTLTDGYRVIHRRMNRKGDRIVLLQR
ncbi:MAG: class I SAM-dependent methyltransferase [Oscillospiraceae bacterium]|nr:class I SAM-dependent methyltransferase [Oscillospiraceae bacterium]